MDKVGEIISRVERRRKWTAERKVKILTEALEPGATVSAVADRNGISRSQLYVWIRLAQCGAIPGISLNGQEKPLFAPVRIEAAPSSLTPALAAPVAQEQRRPGAIEIALTNGRLVRVDERIEPVRLARLVAALDGARS
jgi:transposase-like protein